MPRRKFDPFFDAPEGIDLFFEYCEECGGHSYPMVDDRRKSGFCICVKCHRKKLTRTQKWKFDQWLKFETKRYKECQKESVIKCHV